jgi:hypothetical protein
MRQVNENTSWTKQTWQNQKVLPEAEGEQSKRTSIEYDQPCNEHGSCAAAAATSITSPPSSMCSVEFDHMTTQMQSLGLEDSKQRK